MDPVTTLSSQSQILLLSIDSLLPALRIYRSVYLHLKPLARPDLMLSPTSSLLFTSPSYLALTILHFHPVHVSDSCTDYHIPLSSPMDYLRIHAYPQYYLRDPVAVN